MLFSTGRQIKKLNALDFLLSLFNIQCGRNIVLIFRVIDCLNYLLKCSIHRKYYFLILASIFIFSAKWKICVTSSLRRKRIWKKRTSILYFVLIEKYNRKTGQEFQSLLHRCNNYFRINLSDTLMQRWNYAKATAEKNELLLEWVFFDLLTLQYF